jgi:hypothetical protein
MPVLVMVFTFFFFYISKGNMTTETIEELIDVEGLNLSCMFSYYFFTPVDSSNTTSGTITKTHILLVCSTGESMNISSKADKCFLLVK